MATTNKIMVGIDDQVIELTGSDKESFLEQRAKDQAELGLLEAEQATRKQLRESAIRQLAQTANLSEEQIETLLGGI
jgi:hypothetical protein